LLHTDRVSSVPLGSATGRPRRSFLSLDSWRPYVFLYYTSLPRQALKHTLHSTHLIRTADCQKKNQSLQWVGTLSSVEVRDPDTRPRISTDEWVIWYGSCPRWLRWGKGFLPDFQSVRTTASRRAQSLPCLKGPFCKCHIASGFQKVT
jgi:hypothetical protein